MASATAADKIIVATATYEVTDPTVDSQIVTLREKGADVLFMTGIPKFNAMAIRKTFDIGWKPRTVFHLLHRLLGRHRIRPAGAGKGGRRDHRQPT